MGFSCIILLMSSYKIQPLLSKAVSLLTVESVARQNLFQQVAQTAKSTILTTVEPETHHKYATELAKLPANQNIRVVPYFQPLVTQHYSQGKTEFEHKEDPRGISLLVGNNNPEMLSQLDPSKIITLEELCQAFPEKIPLSFRSKESEAHIQKLQKRIGAQLSRTRVLQFEHIIMISPEVKMWDEAIQVIMDFMPTPFFVPYLRTPTPTPNSQTTAYSLTVEDFLSALRKVQSTMKVVVKNHADPNIVVYNQRKQLDWLISQVAPQAEEMVIDRYFFQEEPKTKEAEEKDIQIPTELASYI